MGGRIREVDVGGVWGEKYRDCVCWEGEMDEIEV